MNVASFYWLHKFLLKNPGILCGSISLQVMNIALSLKNNTQQKAKEILYNFNDNIW